MLDTRSLSNSDFEGQANIFLTSPDLERLNEVYNSFSIMEGTNLPSYFDSEGELKIDLVIKKANYSYQDHNQLVPVMGDTFYHFFYGKAPLMLNLQGVVFDLKGNSGVPDFMDVYKYLLRLSMVAKTKIIPKVRFKNTTVIGAFLSLDKAHKSRTYDHANISTKVLVFKMDYENINNEDGPTSLSIDYSIKPDKNRQIDPPPIEFDLEPTEGFERRVAYDDHAAFADEEVEYVSNKEYFAT